MYLKRALTAYISQSHTIYGVGNTDVIASWLKEEHDENLKNYWFAFQVRKQGRYGLRLNPNPLPYLRWP
ncbi:hypothetical protein JFV29_14075 [Peribacillus sp. TH16]|uniref:hypothetical protein n=1 Tax=Peribacillus sp. TH16 TaxID=2798482 RepID=UPI001913E6EC|nr:hypothetical protein [Peribacillus sp. TH16]MBK5482974.1 hypothetical protein [Peribacillus sp. TH16]MBK5482998.1 hypothetical protein [Peribacillus sp. TH16]